MQTFFIKQMYHNPTDQLPLRSSSYDKNWSINMKTTSNESWVEAQFNNANYSSKKTQKSILLFYSL